MILENIDFDALISNEQDDAAMYQRAARRLRTLAEVLKGKGEMLASSYLINSAKELERTADEEANHSHVIKQIRSVLSEEKGLEPYLK